MDKPEDNLTYDLKTLYILHWDFARLPFDAPVCKGLRYAIDRGYVVAWQNNGAWGIVPPSILHEAVELFEARTQARAISAYGIALLWVQTIQLDHRLIGILYRPEPLEQTSAAEESRPESDADGQPEQPIDLPSDGA